MGFLRTLVVVHALTALAAVAGIAYVWILPRALPPARAPLLLQLGAISPTSVRVWVRAARAPPAVVTWTQVGGEEATSRTLHIPNSEPHVVELALSAGRAYAVRVVDASGDVRQTTVRALAAEAHDFLFVVGSCLMQRSWPLARVALFDRARAERASFAMLLGDSIYTDAPFRLSPAASYELLVNDASFSAFAQNVPTFFQFDDHEIHNDCDVPSSEAFRHAIREYDAVLGRRNPGPHTQRFYSFMVGLAAFMVLDTRSHRSRNGERRVTQLGAVGWP